MCTTKLHTHHFSYSHSLCCDEQGHLIALCPAIKGNSVRKLASVKKANVLNMLPECPESNIESAFKLFVFSGFISLGVNDVKQSINILSGTDAVYLFILESACVKIPVLAMVCVN